MPQHVHWKGLGQALLKMHLWIRRALHSTRAPGLWAVRVPEAHAPELDGPIPEALDFSRNLRGIHLGRLVDEAEDLLGRHLPGGGIGDVLHNRGDRLHGEDHAEEAKQAREGGGTLQARNRTESRTKTLQLQRLFLTSLLRLVDCTLGALGLRSVHDDMPTQLQSSHHP